MNKGFTLMEMVLVMSVIVILFLLTVPNIQKTMTVVHDKGCDAQLKVIDSAILQFQLLNDRIPGSIDELIQENIITQRQRYCSDNREIRIVNGQASL